ncbi:MAG: asparagine synthase (glutamine-hydrolyzing) [Bacteroidia bacterium]
MCGITGILTHTESAEKYKEYLSKAVTALHHRGPDAQGYYAHECAALGHTRLSIIDTSSASAQPFYSADGRFVIVYNGEFFNYKEHKEALQKQGISFRSTGDTEVLLQLYIAKGEAFLENVNGFFTLAIFDTLEKSLFVARDRFGIKPLFYSSDAGKFIFASEMKAMLKYPIGKDIDYASLLQYLQLNYIPAPDTILESVKKFPVGHYCKIKPGEAISFKPFCRAAYPASEPLAKGSFENAATTYFSLLEDAVQKRLIADVPLGTFLSGGLDSSAVTAIAALHKPGLMTFSIGYKDEPMFDESRYAELVSKKLNTNHHSFMLANDDLYNELFNVLDAIDEPFGDSSALPMYILSRKTREHVTVALSGDGGDELMAGYNKHYAEYKLKHSGYLKTLTTTTLPLLRMLPQSRNSKLGNMARQGIRFAEGAKMNAGERYWRWASIAKTSEALELLTPKNMDLETINNKRKQQILKEITGNFNSLLYTDVQLVLQNDMLVKTDSMSMANSLEVRVPLLDYRLVNFLFTLPEEYKITASGQKRILREAVAHLLPVEILTRKKHGFEVPLLKWFKTGLHDSIESKWLNEKHITEQGIFDPAVIKALKLQLYSNRPQDSVARIWGLIVFQHWYKKHLSND